MFVCPSAWVLYVAEGLWLPGGQKSAGVLDARESDSREMLMVKRRGGMKLDTVVKLHSLFKDIVFLSASINRYTFLDGAAKLSNMLFC